jgi:phospholipid-binding lipoprotein MlaA
MAQDHFQPADSAISGAAPDTRSLLIASAETSQPDEDLFEADLSDEYADSAESKHIADPLYYFNYAMYWFNDTLYFAALKPIARGYKAILPEDVRQCFSNFFHNLLFPVRLVNNVFQGKIKEAGTEIEIFVVNSTAGILGFGQAAQNVFNLKTSNEDLGQTLGTYGIGNGFYLVLPVLGPSSFRDTIGLVGDAFLTPVNYVEPWELAYGIKAHDAVNDLSFRLGDYEALKAAALDPYVAIRNAYVQNRMKKIKE